MDSTHLPICYIVAGPNGAGKTTFAIRFLPSIAQCHNFLNADAIAAGLSPLDAKGCAVQAARLFLQQLKEKLDNRQDFAFETTLSGLRHLNLIPQWQSSGWKVVLIYLFIPTAETSAMRVHQRVLQGGHDIPREDIFRRFSRSIRNLFTYMEVCDETFCLDNSRAMPVPIFHKTDTGVLEVFNPPMFTHLKESI